MAYRNTSGFSDNINQSQSGRLTVAVAIVIILLLFILGLRLTLPQLVKNYLNQSLAQMGDYRGHINDVDIALWRGAYSLNELKIVKKDVESVPFFESSAIDLSIKWSALLKGRVVAVVELIAPELHFVDASNDSQQTGTGNDWRETLKQLLPIRIDELLIHQGEIHFHNFNSKPSVHLVLTELNGQFNNITNKAADSKSNYADFELTGFILENARASAEGNLNPLGEFRDFDMKLRVADIDLTKMNDLAEAYGNFSIESGQGEFIMDLKAKDGMLEGYSKPLFDKVEILDVSEDIEKGVLSVAWESLVATLGQIFRNQPEDRIGAQIQITGNLNQENISTWQAFISILRNAFVDAYEAEFREE